ncbi:hypothetical protein COBT_002205, partial [Conglomerata obtusa]
DLRLNIHENDFENIKIVTDIDNTIFNYHKQILKSTLDDTEEMDQLLMNAELSFKLHNFKIALKGTHYEPDCLKLFEKNEMSKEEQDKILYNHNYYIEDVGIMAFSLYYMSNYGSNMFNSYKKLARKELIERITTDLCKLPADLSLFISDCIYKYTSYADLLTSSYLDI